MCFRKSTQLQDVENGNDHDDKNGQHIPPSPTTLKKVQLVSININSSTMSSSGCICDLGRKKKVLIAAIHLLLSNSMI